MDSLLVCHGRGNLRTMKSIPSTSSTKAVPTHSHTDSCHVCGGALQIERRYEVSDRLARALFAALCRSMNLEPYTRGRKTSSVVYVMAPDAATHEQLWTRYKTLVPELDQQLLGVTANFIRQHCGIDVPIAPRT